LSLKTKVDGLSVVWPQNHCDGFLRFGLKIGGDNFLRFGLKTCGDDFLWFDLKISDDVLLFCLKTKVVEGFLVCASKLADTIWWFETQNHRDGFLV
jgi:hypothetical protein